VEETFKTRVQVNIGGKKNTLLSADTLLNFNVTVAIDGEPLSREELDAIYQSETGLMMLRGQYVEIDKDKLQQALDHWQSVQKQVGDGLSLIQRFAPTLKAFFLHPSELNRNDLEGIAANAAQVLSQWDLVVITYGMLQRQPKSN